MSIDSSDPYEREALPKGRLFGAMGADRGVMSLSLLDWRRRRQWAASADQNKNQPKEIGNNAPSSPTKGDANVRLPARVVRAGIDAGLPSWESVNPIPRVPREPSSAMEPSRRRHSNSTYAKWCTKLINCINSSGRMMAHYEFFYSDIDRAW